MRALPNCDSFVHAPWQRVTIERQLEVLIHDWEYSPKDCCPFRNLPRSLSSSTRKLDRASSGILKECQYAAVRDFVTEEYSFLSIQEKSEPESDGNTKSEPGTIVTVRVSTIVICTAHEVGIKITFMPTVWPVATALGSDFALR